MDTSAYYKVGYILKPHGLKGEVTVALDPEFPEDYQTLGSIFIEKNNRLSPLLIESVSVNGKKAFLKFDDVNTPGAAADISKCSLYLPRSLRPKTAKGNFYDDEIISFEVIDSEYGPLGEVKEIILAGSNKLLSVGHAGKEVLIPVNSPFITSVDKSKKKIRVTLPEGFLDI